MAKIKENPTPKVTISNIILKVTSGKKTPYPTVISSLDSISAAERILLIRTSF
jgi:hypothetical protein